MAYWRSALAAALLFTPGVAHAASPEGNVVPTCDGLVGWAQDPDHPRTHIDVHAYFDGPAGDAMARTRVATADVELAEGEGGCAGEACQHGFIVPLPLSRLDAAPHDAYVYGIDLDGESTPQLASSPTTYACEALPITMGQKRHITGPSLLTAWSFSTYFDLMPVADVALASIEEGANVSEGPTLAVAEGATEPLWLLDQGFRREVDAVALAGWRFDPATASVMTAAELDAIAQGSPLPARPVLAQGTGPRVYLLDEVQCLDEDEHPACAPDGGGSTGGASGEEGGLPPDDGDGTGSTGKAASTSAAPDPGSRSEGSGSGGPGATGEGAQTATNGAGPQGCGCTSGGGGGGLGLLLVVLLRRRRVTARSRDHGA